MPTIEDIYNSGILLKNKIKKKKKKKILVYIIIV